jgi:tetratricopeptide (TPR) repeat protein
LRSTGYSHAGSTAEPGWKLRNSRGDGSRPSPGRREGVIAILLVLLLWASGAAAAEPAPAAKPPTEAEAASYEECMKLARHDPRAGLDFAEAWRGRGGAHPAEHCAAVALIGLKRYKEAASRLEALGKAMDKGPSSVRAGVFDQASQAWLLAGDGARAYAAAGEALAWTPSDPELLIDRAEAAGLSGQFDKAVADLDQVLKTNPNRVDALVYRAAALRALKRLEPALADAEKALSLSPNSVSALLERGNIRSLRDDPAGARADWQRILTLDPASPEAATAKANLAASAPSPSGAGTRGAAGPRS